MIDENVEDSIQQFVGYFTQQLVIIKALELNEEAPGIGGGNNQALRFCRKVLLVDLLDTLAGFRFPKMLYPALARKNRERFVRFLTEGSIWPQGELVSIPFLSDRLDKPGRLKTYVEEQLQSIQKEDEWSVNIKDVDQNLSNLILLASSEKEEVAVYEVQHYSLLYRYRNYLVHESREPGGSMEIGADADPHYHGYSKDDKLFLVYPYPMFVDLAEKAIRYINDYFSSHRLDPYTFVTDTGRW